MHYIRKVAIVCVFICLADCSSKAAPPLPSTVYYFPSRTAPARSAAEQTPSVVDPEQSLKTAIEAYKAGNYEASLLAAQSLAGQYPDTAWYGRSLFLTEQVLIRMDRAAEAHAAMLQIKKDYPEMADYAVAMLADYHFLRGRYPEAAALYQDIVTQHPSSSLAARAAYQRGQALLGASDHAEAARLLEGFVRNNPRSDLACDAGLALGRALVAGGQPESAVQAYRDVWARYPGSPAEQGAVKALSELSASGVRVAPWSAEEWYERGSNLFRIGQYDRSAEAFRKLLETDPASPKRPEALFRIGVSQFHSGRRGDAAAALEKMVKDHPRDHRVPEALYWAGRSYSRLGERQQAIATLKEILEKHPKSEWADDALFLIGNIYRDANDPKAFAVYSRLAAGYPESRFSDSAIWWNAWSHYQAGEYAKTEQSLQQLITRYPRSFLVHQARYWQGRAAEKMNDSQKAAEYFSKVLRRGRYTYYGYRAAERLAGGPGLNAPIPAADEPVDLIPVDCDEDDCLDGPFPVDETDEGPPVWTEETQRLLTAESSFKKTLELMHLDMKKEAAAELWHLQAKLPRRRGALIGLSKAFFELGDYYRSLMLVLRNYERYLDGEVRDIPPDLWLLAYPQGYWDAILSWSRKYGQDPYFIAAVIRQESRFHTSALSPAGARGVMQVMPSTGEWIARSIKLQGFDRVKLFESDTAINLGTWYISYLMRRFKGDPLFAAAAYNAGPEAVASWISKSAGVLDRDEFVESIPFAETRGYVKKVLRNYAEYTRIYSKRNQGAPRISEADAGGAARPLVTSGDRVRTP